MKRINKTDSGVFYLHNYIPTRKFSFHSDKENDISKKIWKYKKGDVEAIAHFTFELLNEITAIADISSYDQIGLLGIPPSKVSKESSIEKSINKIVKYYHEGLIKAHFGCNKHFVDYSHLLTRVHDISTAHEGKRASYHEQKRSIKCSEHNLDQYKMDFILLDDVITTGTSMTVCKDILLENGLAQSNLIQMAIARTIDE